MFSTDAKDEIAAVAFARSCCPGAFVRALAAFSKGLARLVLSDRGPVVRAALRAAKAAGVRVDQTRPAGRRFGRRATEVTVAQPLAVQAAMPERACCRRAWLRGAFLACGSVSDPHRSYHLEFVPPDDQRGRALVRGLRSFGVRATRSTRRGRPLVYVKGASAVAELLGHMGASRAVLALDDLLALRYTKNVTRRRVNSEAANAARAAATSVRQHAAAARIMRRSRTRAVSAALQEAARLRLAHPEYTIAELAARARPPVSKAAMAYRLRTIERQA